jgi:hypothetical protein
MKTSAPGDPTKDVYVRKQKAFATPCVRPNGDCKESSAGAGVGMHSPSMQRRTKSLASQLSNENSRLVTSRPSIGNGSTKRVSFGLQVEAQIRSAQDHANTLSQAASSCDKDAPNATSNFISSAVEVDVSRDQSSFLTMFANTTQRDLDTSIQFAMHGGPLVKHSSRAHRPPVLCTFRLIKECTRLVWAEASRPEEEKFGLETSAISSVLVGAAAAAEFQAFSSVPNTRSVTLRLVLLLEGEEKLRLEALDKVHTLWHYFSVRVG